MTKTLKRILGCLTAVFLTILLLAGLTHLTKRGSNKSEAYNFFEYSDCYDVLFLGTSHMMDAVYPYYLWNDYGIVSYNLSFGGNLITTEYWQLINALDYTSPQLIVLDCFQLCNLYKTPTMGFLHNQFDFFPLTLNKFKAVNDLWEENYLQQRSEKYELLWPFISYHNRWNELSAEDLLITPAAGMGAGSCIARADPAPSAPTEKAAEETADTVAVPYLRRIIEECRSRGIDLVLTYVPFPAEEKSYMEANLAAELAAEYGVDFINFLDMDMVDFSTDCFDADSHLNVSGSRKITEYLGKYISSHFAIPDRRCENGYSAIASAYLKSRDFLLEQLSQQDDIECYLVTLRSCDAPLFIRVRAGSSLYENETLVKLIRNIPCAGELTAFGAADSDYFAFIDNTYRSIAESADGLCCAESPYGTVCFSAAASGQALLTVGDSTDYYAVDGGETPDIQVVVLTPDGEYKEELCRNFYLD